MSKTKSVITFEHLIFKAWLIYHFLSVFNAFWNKFFVTMATNDVISRDPESD